MRLLLDTHLALWWLLRSRQVPIGARQLVEQSTDPVFISRASLWEMAIKISIAKLQLDLPRFIKMAESSGFHWLDITNQHLLAVANLPVFADHRDPFDRLLVAQSVVAQFISPAISQIISPPIERPLPHYKPW